MIESLRREIAVACAGFQGAQDGAESFGRRGHFEFAVKVIGQPVAKGGGADGVHVARVERAGHAGARLAVFGDEGGGATGVMEERGGLVGVGDAGHAYFGSKVALDGEAWAVVILEVIARRRKTFSQGR